MGIKPLDYEPEGSSKWKYNGKEHEEATGFDEYEARSYASDISRFMVVDPKTETYHDWSGYVYAGNNPTTYMDIRGEGPGKDTELTHTRSLNYKLQEDGTHTISMTDVHTVKTYSEDGSKATVTTQTSVTDYNLKYKIDEEGEMVIEREDATMSIKTSEKTYSVENEKDSDGTVTENLTQIGNEKTNVFGTDTNKPNSLSADNLPTKLFGYKIGLKYEIGRHGVDWNPFKGTKDTNDVHKMILTGGGLGLLLFKKLPRRLKAAYTIGAAAGMILRQNLSHRGRSGELEDPTTTKKYIPKK
jgi:RHS repeat-associated protein